MSEQNYAFKDYEKEKMARSIAKNLGISTKKTIEVCSFIRGKKIRSARNFLNRVLKMEDAVPYKRFNQELAHNQRGPSGYPIKVVKEVLKLIGDAEANAKAKGLNPENLKILHISANRGSHAMHYGRQRRRMMKRTHLEIVLQEIAAPASKKASAEKKTPDSSKKSETKKPE
ncbi:MAG: 50S ribosomal protein L22, partial [Candidatus Woesearchaeota archaeon]